MGDSDVRITRRRTRELSKPAATHAPAKRNVRQRSLSPIDSRETTPAMTPGLTDENSTRKRSQRPAPPSSKSSRDSNNPFSTTARPTHISLHGGGKSWMATICILLLRVFCVGIVLAAFSIVYQRHKTSEANLEQCSVGLQQKGKWADELQSQISTQIAKISAFEEELNSLRKRLKDADRASRDSALTLQACENRERECKVSLAQTSQDSQACSTKLGTIKQQYETCKSEAQSHAVRSDTCKKDLQESQRQLTKVTSEHESCKQTQLQHEFETKAYLENIKSCETELADASDIVAQATQCIKDLAACEEARTA